MTLAATVIALLITAQGLAVAVAPILALLRCPDRQAVSTLIDQRFGLLRPGAVVVDLGAAPGGWAQVAVERVRARAGRGRVGPHDARVERARLQSMARRVRATPGAAQAAARSRWP